MSSGWVLGGLQNFQPTFDVLLCSSVLQAPKKAKRRQQQGEGGSSNVFSMFEQSQIQEYKEVSSSCWLPRGHGVIRGQRGVRG